MAKNPGSTPAPDLIPRTLRHAYLRTELTIELATGAVSAEDAAAQMEGPVYVVTAANPRSVQADADENAERHRLLVGAVDKTGIDHSPALGRDPFSDWTEPSLALFGTTRKKVRKLGRDFDQYAIFEITPKLVTVHGCLSRWKLSRSHDERSLPENDETLADAVARAHGIEIVADLKRFRHRGWQSVGPTQRACSKCEAPAAELFAVVHQRKRGDIVEHLAVVCLSCGAAMPTTGLPAGARTAVDRWSDHALASADAAAAGLTAPGYRCYVIRLDRPDDRWVYVGQTSKSSEDRFAEHLEGGTKASNVVTQHGVDLRHDLMADLPEFPDRLSAETFERYLAAKLPLAGFEVAGGH
jgi:Protein of unknown function (DUF3293)